MCGICGVVEKNADLKPLVQRMHELIAHRGPDASSVYQAGDICLGHRRLSIIDLATGDQPIFSSDGKLAIIYNGEVYNYRELRQQLVEKGYRFQTESDTEVVLVLYQDQGPEAFAKLNGIFAFAILDRRGAEPELVLARDHFGIKPLHYYCRDGRFVFASEQKAILLHPAVERAVNPQALHIHMNLRYTQSDETLFKDIFRLPPAHYMVVKNGQVHKKERYFELDYKVDYRRSEEEWLEEIPVFLKQAVKRQLMSDVPIGVYLSGGMDSSAIVAMMREAGADKINTFTLGFNEPSDENPDAQLVADHFATEHHDLQMNANPMRLMPQVIWHAEEPKINLLQGFLMSQFVSKDVKVVLGGLGGDELFAGYDIHRFIYPFNRPHALVPSGIERHLLSPVSSGVYQLQKRVGSMASDEYRRGLQMALATGNITKFYLILRNVWDYDRSQWREIYTDRFCQQQLHPVGQQFDRFFGRNSGTTPLDEVFYAEFNSKMVNDYLLTEDRMSMANSVEERVPFLDLELVKFGFSIPAGQKMRVNQTKYLLRKALKPYLPEKILAKKKWGFTFNPYLQFQKDLKATAQLILTKERIEADAVFNYSYIRQILDARPHPRMRWHYNFIWVLTGYYLWKQMYIDSNQFMQREFDLEAYTGK